MDFADKDIRDLLPFVPANSPALVEGQGETCEDPTSPGVHFVPISEVEAETGPPFGRNRPRLRRQPDARVSLPCLVGAYRVGPIGEIVLCLSLTQHPARCRQSTASR